MRFAVYIEGLDEARNKIDGIDQRLSNLSTPLSKLGLYHQRKAGRILRSGERGIQARNPAGLAASITYAQPDRNSLLVGSNKAYAASQQFGPAGGFYRPTQHDYLAIPVLDNIGARGNPRYSSPRDVEDGFFFRSDKGQLFFARRKKKRERSRRRRRTDKPVWGETIDRPIEDDKIEVLFVLVQQSRGTAHYYITHDPDDQPTWDRFAADWVLRGR